VLVNDGSFFSNASWMSHRLPSSFVVNVPTKVLMSVSSASQEVPVGHGYSLKQLA
jgi:hypothetical protein